MWGHAPERASRLSAESASRDHDFEDFSCWCQFRAVFTASRAEGTVNATQRVEHRNENLCESDGESQDIQDETGSGKRLSGRIALDRI